ncbi:MAG: hypothetical protein PVF74_06150 [Anaerolineales bacterium]
MPHLDCQPLCDRLAATLDIPAWPQLPRRDFRENMYAQFSTYLPGIVLDVEKEKVYFDTSNGLATALETFYESYLANDVSAFALSPKQASGFFSMLGSIDKYPGNWVKGQVTGPISLGLTVTDQDMRASLYDDILVDVLVKNTVMNARWQVQELGKARSNVIIFVDEPYMASFGSAYISLSREQVISMLDEVFEGIHDEGGVAGVHCCGNTDWSVLLATKVDILNLDAYGYIDNLSLYSTELRNFLDRGGIIAWGILPNDERITKLSPAGIARRLRAGLENISRRATSRGVEINIEEFTHHSLILPSCGLGPTTVDAANQILDKLIRTGQLLQLSR